MLKLSGVRTGLAVALLTAGLWQVAGAAEIRMTNVEAAEDAKHVKLTFTFSEPVKPDVTYFYTHNYVGLRATGLRFTSNQLKREVPPPSEDAARTYRAVRFVQDNESGEIRLYLTKPLTPADAQVVPFDTYTEVTLLKPPGQGKPMTPLTEEQKPAAPEPSPSNPEPAEAATETPVQPAPATGTATENETPPTLRTGTPDEYTSPEAEGETEASEADAAEHDTQPVQPAIEPGKRDKFADHSPVDYTPSEPEPGAKQAGPPQVAPRIGGPSYKGFDLDKVPVNQLVFKGKPFREALMELVGDSGYNIVVADYVDNSEVTLNFAQKQLSLKSALDLLAQAFDLTWSVEDDAIVVKAKPQP